MSKKKNKTRLEKQVKRHDFSHLVRTRTAARVVEAENEVSGEAKSPLDKQVGRDLRMVLITIGVFVIVIVLAWLFIGKNGEIYNLTNKIKLF